MLCFDDHSDELRAEEDQWSLLQCCEIITIADDSTGAEPLAVKAKKLGLIEEAAEKALDEYLEKQNLTTSYPSHTGDVCRLEPLLWYGPFPTSLFRELLPLIIEGVLYFKNGLNELCRLVIFNRQGERYEVQYADHPMLNAGNVEDHKLDWTTLMTGPTEESDPGRAAPTLEYEEDETHG
jgi:hypothetical protein